MRHPDRPAGEDRPRKTLAAHTDGSPSPDARTLSEHFELIARATNDVVWDWDLQTGRLWWNENFQSLFGYPPAETEPGIESWYNRLHPDDRDRVIAGIHAVIDGGGHAWSDEYRFGRRDGSHAEIYDRGFVIRDSAGRAVRMIGAMMDITERKRAEAALRESQRMFATLLSNLPGAVYRCRNDAAWTIDFVSDGIAALTGYPAGAFMRTERAFPELIHPDDLARVRREVAQAVEERRPFRNVYRLRAADGEEKWIWGQGRGVYGADGELLFLEGFITDITEYKRAEDALRESQSQLRLAIQASHIGLWDWNLETNHVYYSPEWKRQLGYDADEIAPTYDQWRRLTHPKDVDRVGAAVRAYLEGLLPAYEVEFRMRHKDGSYRWIYARGELVADETGTARRMVGCHVDITERKRAEEQTARHAMRQETVAALGQFALGHAELDVLMDKAAAETARALGVEYCKILEHVPEDQCLLLRARAGWDARHPARLAWREQRDSLETYCLSRHEATKTDDLASETRFAPYDFEREAGARAGAAVVIHGGGRPYGVLSVHTVRTHRFSADEMSFLQSVANVLAAAIERGRTEERLAHLAQYDPLTGLPNRNLFRDRLARAVARAQRDERLAALLFLDLDQFKGINDTLGHAAGDRVLKDVSARLRACLRADDTIARLGGDEFTVILEELTASAQVRRVAEKIQRALAAPVYVEDKEFFVTASIGIAVYPYDGKDGESLLKHADIAMYQAKNEGRNNFQFYASTMSAATSDRVSLERGLRQALERAEFQVHYQPIVDIGSGRVVGLEALLRWQHPEWGLVRPGRFLPLAEQTGLIVPIGEWVLHEVCAQNARWREAGMSPVRVAVNLSARQFRKANLADVVANALAVSGTHGSLLELEITESLLMESPETTSRLLEQLKQMGVHVALDDFGTGYSSFAYLKHFPLDVLKIDQSFVRDLTTDPDDAAIVTGMIELAHSLQLKLTAEGVETEAQLQFLQRHRCDYAQGYLFSRPQPAEALHEMLRTREVGPAKSA